MDEQDAIDRFSALAQETRLAAFRLLVRHEPDGLPAGDIARLLDVPHNTMSAHLAVLTRAGLAVSQRHSRSIIYRAHLDHMQETVRYLVRDCCGGRPEVCQPLLDSLTDGIAAPIDKDHPMQPLIYHNPDCGTSRNTLAMIEASGETPEIVEYLETPPSRERLLWLLHRMGMAPRDLLRRKGTPYDELNLDDPSLTDEQLVDAMLAHPILINRPIVVTDKGVRLCRPSEQVLDLLARPVAHFTKEDGEVVTDAQDDA